LLHAQQLAMSLFALDPSFESRLLSLESFTP